MPVDNVGAWASPSGRYSVDFWKLRMRFKRLVLNAFFASLSCSTGAFGEECPDWLETDFWKSAEPEEVHSCLQAGRSLFERTDDGETPLHLSVAAASPDTVLELLRSGADVSLTTTDGLTPLHVAARDTIHGTVISYLLVYGSEVDKRIPPNLCYAGTCAETALHLAADRRPPERGTASCRPAGRWGRPER